MAKKPTTIDEYLAPLSADKRAALRKLRRDIRAAAPGVEEVISYGVPAVRLGGRLLVWFGVGARHCAFYPGKYPIEANKDALGGYELSKGTVRFPPGKPLSTALVKKLVRARIAERERIAERGRTPKARRRVKA